MTSLLLLALLVAPSVYAEEPPADLLEKERVAFDKVAAELVKLSRTCTQSKAYDEARAVLDLGLRVHPESAVLREARDAIEGKADEPRESFAAKYPKKRVDAFLRCAKALASAALQYDRKGHADRFERLFALARRHFPSKDGCAAFKLEYYEPFLGSMLMKCYIGYTLDEIGATDPGTGNVEPNLPAVHETNYIPMQGWMMKHFRLVYRTAYYNPHNQTEYKYHTDEFSTRGRDA